ncbi:MAG: uroporphyrinogen-III C-methyltransferase [Dehalococcoidales bacterium]|nr:uroporphyrinogen-III C-methyltransferase [Dehalococcoidales bacterium]
MKRGKVYLVGAGPGDPGLISKRGLDCLAQAEVIVYDRLLDERLLDSASPEAERIYVGKSASQHSKTQDEINRLLVQKAGEGKVVVRLKGGDPFVFGRGGEEAAVLVDKQLPFEVVPGVTSAVAVPAYAGIPVTHRGLASSFAVITGHEDPAKAVSSIDWAKLATAVDTLVFLMGMENLPQIVARLVEHGRPADTPVAVIEQGTRPGQKTAVGSLADIVDRVTEQSLRPPAVIVVGEVVGLREKLRWFDNRPLFGKRVLVTRARHQASALSRLLTERGAQPVELPAIDIQAAFNSDELDRAILQLKQYQWLVFTSVNGVEAFFQRLHALNLDSRSLGGLKVGVIGPATAGALALKGIVPDYMPEVYTGQGFVNGLKKLEVGGQRFLLPRADIADKELVEGLMKLGAEAREIAAYRTLPAVDAIARARQMLSDGEIDVITFTSSSTVSNLVTAFQGEPPPVNGAKVACIGPKTAETAVSKGLKVDILAREQTIPGLVTAIEEYFGKEA